MNDNISANPPMQTSLDHTDRQNAILVAAQASYYTIVTKFGRTKKLKQHLGSLTPYYFAVVSN